MKRIQNYIKNIKILVQNLDKKQLRREFSILSFILATQYIFNNYILIRYFTLKEITTKTLINDYLNNFIQ